MFAGATLFEDDNHPCEPVQAGAGVCCLEIDPRQRRLRANGPDAAEASADRSGGSCREYMTLRAVIGSMATGKRLLKRLGLALLGLSVPLRAAES
jgi:hypothetical protein